MNGKKELGEKRSLFKFLFENQVMAMDKGNVSPGGYINYLSH